MTKDALKKLFDHMAWADREVLEALAAAAPESGALETFAHLLGAELVWLDRVERVEQSVAVWPEATLGECAALSRLAGDRYRRFLGALPVARLAERIRYSNSDGREFESRLDDILVHVALHGSYHRGQIAAQLRGAGARPRATDYIGFVRGAPAARRDGENHG